MGEKFGVTGIELYAIANVATYENVGTVKPEKEKEIYVEADGRIYIYKGI